jgi:cytochrome c-type biogenesis protein CcmH
MRSLLPILAVLAVLATPAVASGAASLPDIEDEVMCVECGTALNISQSPAADGERRFIRRRIAEGLTKEQIKAALVAEYGRNVLGSPPDKGFARAIYLVPIGLAVVVALALALAARRWRRPSEGTETGGPALDDADAERLKRDMAGYDL